jgi:hypothetical protein
MHFLSAVCIAAIACEPLAPTLPTPEPALKINATPADDKSTGILGGIVRTGGVDQIRFGLGASQFLEAIEHLGQGFYKYGLRTPAIFRMLGRTPQLPLPTNPHPELITHAAADQMIKDFVRDLHKAEQTLAGVKDDQVKLPVRLNAIRLDLRGDGKRDVGLLEVMAPYFRGSAFPKNADVLVHFDRGDVAWLRGYCHLLEAFCEFILAHDARDLFDILAPQVFPRVQSKFGFMLERADRINSNNIDTNMVLDAIAAVHMIRLPVREPARMRAALEHLEQMVKLGRESWKFILAEKDDDHEWIPNPRQKGVLGVPVTQGMIDSWMEFLDETEALLQGKRLAPFWRGDGKEGINLRRVFTEPQTFDLVLWIQGAGAVPYLEQGMLTRKEVWQRLLRVFRGEFVGFAIWFN